MKDHKQQSRDTQKIDILATLNISKAKYEMLVERAKAHFRHLDGISWNGLSDMDKVEMLRWYIQQDKKGTFKKKKRIIKFKRKR